MSVLVANLIPGVFTSAGPAWVTYGNKTFLVWKGEGSDSGIYLSKLGSDGTWAPQWVPSGIGGSNDGPALAVTQGLLYMAWMDEPGGTRIFFATSKDGVNWSPQAQVQGV